MNRKMGIIVGMLVVAVVLLSIRYNGTEASDAPEADPSKGIVFALIREGLPVQHIITFDAKTDRDGLMGKPGRYISKTAFVDARHTESWNDAIEHDPDFSPETFWYDCYVETYASEADAQKQYEYFADEFSRDACMYKQHVFIAGNAILFLDYELSDNGAKGYEKAFNSICVR